jgi:hypothetical protein
MTCSALPASSSTAAPTAPFVHQLPSLYSPYWQTKQIDYDKASSEYGAKSVESFRVCTNAALKKIENAGGKTGASASTSATPKKGGGRKRKATPADDDDEEAAPTTKKKGGRKIKAQKEAEAAAAAAEEAEDGGVKAEDSEWLRSSTATWLGFSMDLPLRSRESEQMLLD